MKIAQVAPIAEPVPPPLYGGVERVVSYLTEELIKAGHDVTLFASGDSRTSAKLYPVRARALRLDDPSGDYISYHLLALAQTLRRLHEFDIVHFHTDPLHFPYVRLSPKPIVTTLHGRLDGSHVQPLLEGFREVPIVSVSEAQRPALQGISWLGTVHHGLPRDLYSLSTSPEHYVVFLGRIAPEKRPDLAIEIARRAGVPIRLAAKVDRVDQLYFVEKIKPLLNDPLTSYEGEISDEVKQSFLGKARALLCPGDWPEPFGLVCIEAFACGTPVIATRHGALTELVEHGRTGFLVDSIEEASQWLSHIDELDRQAIRDVFEQRFTAERMARDYIRLYENLRSVFAVAAK